MSSYTLIVDFYCDFTVRDWHLHSGVVDRGKDDPIFDEIGPLPSCRDDKRGIWRDLTNSLNGKSHGCRGWIIYGLRRSIDSDHEIYVRQALPDLCRLLDKLFSDEVPDLSAPPDVGQPVTLVVDVFRTPDFSKIMIVDWTIVDGTVDRKIAFQKVGALTDSDKTVHGVHADARKPVGFIGWRCWAYYSVGNGIKYAELANMIIPAVLPDLHKALASFARRRG